MFARFLKSNNFIIVISVMLALALWVFVVGDSIFHASPKRKVLENVPLVYINLDEKLKVSEFSGDVTVILEGLPEILAEIKSDDLLAFVDLKEKGPGKHKPDIKINPPEGLSVVSFLPSNAQVVISPK